jgi:hypothetical protein
MSNKREGDVEIPEAKVGCRGRASLPVFCTLLHRRRRSCAVYDTVWSAFPSKPGAYAMYPSRSHRGHCSSEFRHTL